VSDAVARACSSRMAQPRMLGDLLLYRLGRLVGAAGLPAARLFQGRHGITRREWRMLALLAEGGAMHPSALAARGWARRSAHASDQRYALVELTEAGRQLHAQLFPEIAALNRQLLGALPPETVDALDLALQRLQAQAEHIAATCALPKARSRRGRARPGP